MTYLSPILSFHVNLWRRIEAHSKERWLEMKRVSHRLSNENPYDQWWKTWMNYWGDRWRNGFGAESQKLQEVGGGGELRPIPQRKKWLEMKRVGPIFIESPYGMVKITWIIEKVRKWGWYGITKTWGGWRRRGSGISERGIDCAVWVEWGFEYKAKKRWAVSIHAAVLVGGLSCGGPHHVCGHGRLRLAQLGSAGDI